MIKKVGSKYCLFTANGSRKLGCHSTRVEALTQERAVQARKRSAFDFITVREMADLCPKYAADMRGRNLVAVSVQALASKISPHLKNGRRFFDPDNDAPSPSREFLKQMFSLLRKRLTKKDFDDAVRQARAKAGGIMSGRKRKRSKVKQAYAS